MEINQKVAALGLTGALAIAVHLVMGFEGFSNHAYKDPPGIHTICFGHAENVKVGQVANDDECVVYLKKDLDNANATLNRDVKVQLSDKTRAAFIDLIYNLGTGTFERSSLPKMLNQGRIKDACNKLPQFDHSDGKVLKGLVKRRLAEQKLCLEGLK